MKARQSAAQTIRQLMLAEMDMIWVKARMAYPFFSWRNGNQQNEMVDTINATTGTFVLSVTMLKDRRILDGRFVSGSSRVMP
jgi:hypothetical protein